MKLKSIKPETIFLILAIIYGLTFLLINPPFQVPDEDIHFYKALGLTEGYLMPEKIGNGAGFPVPEDTCKLIESFPPNINFYKKLTINDITSRINVNIDKNTTSFVDLSFIIAVTYSPIPYIIPSSAISIGKFFDLSPLLLLYLARLANLIVWILLVYLAIRVIPVHKWVLLMIALMPMTLYEAASVSADSLTIGLSFLLIAYILKLVFDKDKFTKTSFAVLMVLSGLIALSKSIYILIFFMFLLIPTDKFRDNKMKYGIFATILLSIGSIAGIWMLIYSGLYMTIIPNCSPSGQFYFILGHPSTYLNIILGTFMNKGSFYLVCFVGYLGLFDVPLPFILTLAYLLVMVFVAMIDKSRFNVSLRQKLVCLIIFILGFGAVVTFDYVTWNVVGGQIINGIQGRYFIPFAPLLFLLFYGHNHIKFRSRNVILEMSTKYKLLVVESIVIILSLMIFMLFIYYY
ncbi:MAG: DUF2142 domain-containing protein [Methanobacterium paludis]|nr:DUF2142 domain-containing protein [Methanobacterium paludis]